MKNKTNKKIHLSHIIISLLFFISLGSTVFFGYQYVNEIMNNQSTKQSLETQKEKYIQDYNVTSTNSLSTVKQKVDIEEIKNEIPDAKMWLNVPDAKVNEVVVKGKDNEEYLRSNPDHTYNVYGTLLSESDLDADISKNYVNYIFGHKGTLDGVRFSNLDVLADKSEERHFYIYQNGKEYDYVVQDYIEVLPKTSIYPNNLFTTRDTEQLKSALKENGASQSTIDDVKKDNNYMFLVTCINWDNSTARKIAIGKLVKTINY